MDGRRRVYNDDEPPANGVAARYLVAGGFHTYVSLALTVLLGMHVYSYFMDGFDGNITDAKKSMKYLTKELAEVNRKHETLQTEIERISAALPAVAAAASRTRDALEPRRNARHMLDVFDYDRQIVDYALESAGAKILDSGDTVEHMRHESFVGWSLQVLAAWMCKECTGARAMLRPGTLPGECWAFKGSRAEATVRLLGTVLITGFSLEHIPAHISPTREISSAPRVFTIEGLESSAEPYPHEFGTFEYDKKGKPIQYFQIQKPASRGYNMVRLKVLSNWGHPVFTCVYRLRVHGDLAPGQVPEDEGSQVDSE